MNKEKRPHIRLSACIFAACLQFSIFADPIDFYFVQITDTHWGEHHNVEKTQEAIDNINALPLPIRFVALTGDAAADPFENQDAIDSGLVVMRTCKYPVFYLPGNHDISFKKFDESLKAYIKNFGPINNRTQIQGVTIITYFNFKIKGAFGKTIYDPLAQLDSLMKGKPKGSPVIVFQHDPTVVDFYKNEAHPGWPAQERDSLQSLCERNNVRSIISGHFHRDELHWLGQIPLFVSQPISKKGGRPSTFRVYRYEDGKLSYFSQYAQNSTFED